MIDKVPMTIIEIQNKVSIKSPTFFVASKWVDSVFVELSIQSEIISVLVRVIILNNATTFSQLNTWCHFYAK